MGQEYFTLADIVRLIKVQPLSVYHWIQTGQLPEPKIRVGSRRIWSAAEVAEIAAKMKIEKAAELEREEQ